MLEEDSIDHDNDCLQGLHLNEKNGAIELFHHHLIKVVDHKVRNSIVISKRSFDRQPVRI